MATNKGNSPTYQNQVLNSGKKNKKNVHDASS